MDSYHPTLKFAVIGDVGRVGGNKSKGAPQCPTSLFNDDDNTGGQLQITTAKLLANECTCRRSVPGRQQPSQVRHLRCLQPLRFLSNVVWHSTLGNHDMVIDGSMEQEVSFNNPQWYLPAANFVRDFTAGGMSVRGIFYDENPWIASYAGKNPPKYNKQWYTTHEVAALRRRVETLAAREAELIELVSEREGALAAADAALEKRASESRELGAALAKAQEGERRRGEEEALLRQRLGLAEDTVKIKDKMLDSQNASLADLKAEIVRLKDAARESEEAAGRAAAEWKERLRDEMEQGRALRAELDAQDATLADLEDKLEAERGAAKRAAGEAKELKAKLDEKDGVLRFVEQEVDRVKGLFESKERELAGERDGARERARAAEAAARESLEAAEKERGALRKEIDELRSECEALRKASAASDATMAQVSARCQQRVSEVEDDECDLLRAMERQKAKSAAKVQQLSAFVEELQRSS